MKWRWSNNDGRDALLALLFIAFIVAIVVLCT